MRSPLLLTSVLAALATAGCGLPAEDRPDAEAASANATALVVVERTAGPGDTNRGNAVIARFVRVHEGKVDDQALRIAGAALDLPAMGTCSVTKDTQPALQPRAMDLLDVGTLSVVGEGPNKGTVLVARTMPDPTGLVSGVFYSAQSAASESASAPTERLQLHTSGSAELPDGFNINVASPHDMTDVRVESVAAGLDVSWDAADAVPNDTVYVDVVGTSGRLVARCTTLDVGHTVIPEKALAVLALDETQAQLTVHRLHRESIKAKGIEPGSEIRFDVARVVTFRR